MMRRCGTGSLKDLLSVNHCYDEFRNLNAPQIDSGSHPRSCNCKSSSLTTLPPHLQRLHTILAVGYKPCNSLQLQYASRAVFVRLLKQLCDMLTPAGLQKIDIRLRYSLLFVHGMHSSLYFFK